MPAKSLNWATSKTIGGVSELAVLAPVKQGCPPQESRTYEQRLRELIDNIAGRHQQGLPIELSRVPSIHFGRLILIRPEQYMLYSDVPGVDYGARPAAAARNAAAPGQGRVPTQLNDYRLDQEPPPLAPPGQPPALPSARGPSRVRAAAPKPSSTLRTWLLTLVEFDGDLQVYMRDIVEALGADFDNLFDNCEHYPGSSNFELFWIWIRRFQINTSLFYAPYANLSVARIRQLEEFKNRFDLFVAKVRSPLAPLATPIDQLFDEFLRETQQSACDFPSPSGMFSTRGAEGG